MWASATTGTKPTRGDEIRILERTHDGNTEDIGLFAVDKIDGKGWCNAKVADVDIIGCTGAQQVFGFGFIAADFFLAKAETKNAT